jgi:AraC-like DNA-binding protein
VPGQSFTLDPNFKALLQDLGLPPARVLRRARLPGDLLARGPAVISTEDYYRLWEAIAAEGGERSLAVEIGRAISVEHFSAPIFAALCSPNLEIAAERMATHKPLIGPLRLEVDAGTSGLSITCHWPVGPPPPSLLAVAELTFWVALARIATRHPVRPLRVTAPQIPPDRASLMHFFGVRVTKAATHAITFAPGDATRPFLTENEEMWRFFAPELRRRLSDLEDAASVADRVRAALHETLPAGDTSITAVTRQLAVSSRTLQRRLHLEGTTFQEVLTSTRESLARHYLGRSSMRAAEIAYLLGYEDTNSFYRAFKTWTGTTPDAIRAADSRSSGLPAES